MTHRLVLVAAQRTLAVSNVTSSPLCSHWAAGFPEVQHTAPAAAVAGSAQRALPLREPSCTSLPPLKKLSSTHAGRMYS